MSSASWYLSGSPGLRFSVSVSLVSDHPLAPGSSFGKNVAFCVSARGL